LCGPIDTHFPEGFMRVSPVAVVVLLMGLAACASTPSARLTRALDAYAGTFNHSIFSEMGVSYWGASRWAHRPGLCIADGVLVPHSMSSQGPRVGSLRLDHVFGVVGDIERDEDSLSDADGESEQAACAEAHVTNFFSVTPAGEDADLALRGARAFARLVADGCGSVSCDAATKTAVEGLKGLRLRQVSYCRADDKTCLVLDAGDPDIHTVVVTFREEPAFAITVLRGESGATRVD
jgi:hypothetical protein